MTNSMLRDLYKLESRALDGLAGDFVRDPDLARAGQVVITVRRAAGIDPGQLYWTWVHEVGSMEVRGMQDRPAYGGDDVEFEEAWSRFHCLLPCNQA